jgi:hypothetical protein
MSKKNFHFSSPRNYPAGIGTMHANDTCWLPGFIGPVPPPLLIRNILLLSYEKYFIILRGPLSRAKIPLDLAYEL